MSMENVQRVADIIRENNITVFLNSPLADPNQGWCAGDRIYIGKFDDPDLMLAALCHEYGHILSPMEVLNNITQRIYEESDRFGKHGRWKTDIERLAWKEGIQFANSLGIKFNRGMLKYAATCLRTYYSYNG